MSEILLYRKTPDQLGLRSPVMLVNSEKHNTGSCGLVHPLAPQAGEPQPTGRFFVIIGDNGLRRYILAGFLTPVRNRTFVRFQEGAFEAGFLSEAPGAPQDELVIIEGTDPNELLRTFGERCMRRTPPRPVRRLLAWNSWDYYFGGFGEDDLSESLDAITSFNRSSLFPVECCVIDMCYHSRYGDWRGNALWPNGMRHAAKQISDRGLIPGIWVAPHEIAYDSRVFLRHPEVLLRNLSGDIDIDEWAGGGFGWLDPTRPEGERYLFELFHSLHEDGFRYFKLDFLHYLVTHSQSHRKRFADETIGRIGVIRRSLEIVRSAIGEESYLLSCGCMPEAAAGIADANRIGIDVSTYHSTVKLIAPFLGARAWMNERLFLNDPDFLIVRSDATATDCRHNPFHPANFADAFGSRSGEVWTTENEARIWASLAAVSSGAWTLADHLGKLNERGRAMIENALRYAKGAAAECPDLMEKLYPERYLRENQLLIVNWDDQEKTFDVPELRRFRHAADVWGNAVWDDHRLVVAPRDAVWLVAAPPQAL